MSEQDALDWELFSVSDLREQLGEDSVAYKQFLSVPALSCGLYRLKAGSKDMQSPHDDDEVYYVLEGEAQVEIAGDVKDVRPGDLIYIRATETHRLFEVKQDMLLLVFFSNAK